MQKSLSSSLIRALSAFTVLLCPLARAVDLNYAAQAQVSVSSQYDDYRGAHVNDGVVSDQSRWLAAKTDPNPWVELAFAEPINVGVIDVFSGWKEGSTLEAFDLSVLVDGKWRREPNWTIRYNQQSARRIYIDRQQVRKIRLSLPQPGYARIREIAVYDNQQAVGLKDVGQ